MREERRIAVVTGATGGIGRWIALHLARAGLHVVLVGRDHGRLQAARAFIDGRIAAASLEVALADLSLLGQARRLGEKLAAAHPRIGVLVNNAGVFRSRREWTAEGRESVLATNHLSPFVLTEGLRPALQAGGRARVVNVGSRMSERVGIDADDLELDRNWGPVRAYGRSKLAMTMATFEWADRLKADGVLVNVVHPGDVATGLMQSNGFAGVAWRLLTPLLMTPEQGAMLPVHAALSPVMEGVTGCYLKDKRISLPNSLALDPVLRRSVWAATERLVGAEKPVLA